MIHYSKQCIQNDDIKAVISVLKSDYLTTGPAVPKFERYINNFVGSKFSVAVNSGTSALHISCLALGLKKGDILWTSPNSFCASANCALHCGAKVNFVDINKEDFNICLNQLEHKLKEAKKKKKLPKIIIPVHFAGYSCDMKYLNFLSKKYKFKIIEDASHALGGKYLNKNVGNCKFSDITVFSFHPVKTITTIEGGIATTNNETIYKKLLLLRNHGINKSNIHLNDTLKLRSFYNQELLGFNFRMNDVQAALGISQLKKINKFIHLRKKISKFYDDHLKELPLKTQKRKLFSTSSHHLYVINLVNKFFKRDDLLRILKKNKINAGIHYIPIHLHSYYRNLGFKKGHFPNSEQFYKNAISLPIYPDLQFKQLKFIIKIIKNFFII
jgi:UDP-4-amino-4,6-dideoxy-N-acetyl-beta-L-altrosamine transaminase